jgi:hypothetical protein
MQNPVVLESDEKNLGIWTRSAKGCRKASSDDSGESKGRVVSTKELC